MTWRRCFSNFSPYERTVVLWVDGFHLEAALTPEHYFQAHKALDRCSARMVLTARTPGQAKRIARQAPLRPDWQQIRIDVMRAAIREKFVPGTEAYRELMEHEGPIVEHNTWHDNFWGDCRCPRCRGNRGENMLGRLLMALRAELRQS